MGIYKTFDKHLSNVFGWSSKRKIIVFESDDWGSIRMPSRKAYHFLLEKGLPVNVGDSNRYNMFDSLESPHDLEALFTVLSGIKDGIGNHPVFTAMSLIANPDFENIRQSQFSSYFFEPVTETFNKYGFHGSHALWLHGRSRKLFEPQFHGREHLNVPLWMRALQSNDTLTMEGFHQGFWGFRNKSFSPVNYQAAFDLDNPGDLEMQMEIIKTGLELFEQLNGYKAEFFVPPNGPINRALFPIAAQSGIKGISTAKKHLEPLGNNKFKKSYHYLGQRNNHGQVFLTRNCSFEPSYQRKDWVTSCLKEISIAFAWKKPAIISTHRVNYIGVHDEKNRKEGLGKLRELINKILSLWPDVEFMSSRELAEVVKENRN
jgi:hypothetical protein